MQKNFHLLHILISLKAVISRREPLRPGFESPTNRTIFFCDDPINEFAIRHFVIAFAFFCIAEIPA